MFDKQSEAATEAILWRLAGVREQDLLSPEELDAVQPWLEEREPRIRLAAGLILVPLLLLCDWLARRGADMADGPVAYSSRAFLDESVFFVGFFPVVLLALWPAQQFALRFFHVDPRLYERYQMTAHHYAPRRAFVLLLVLAALISGVAGWHVWAHADVVGPQVVRTTGGHRWGHTYAHQWSEAFRVALYEQDLVFGLVMNKPNLEIAFANGSSLHLAAGDSDLDERRLEEIVRYAGERADLPITRARTRPSG